MKSTRQPEAYPPVMRRARWDRATWAGLLPNGLGQVKPNHYVDMAKTVWENRDQLPFAWRILARGVCDGCALGTTGMKDWTMPGPHLCTVRLGLLRLNTMPAMDPAALSDVGALQGLSGAQLRTLGRLPYPMMRKAGDGGFARVTWDDALDAVAARIRATTPDRLAFYLTARGLTNEVYYVAQKAVRFLGTNNVDNSARICHSPSTFALKSALGIAASSCSYRDWIGSDLLVFIGADVPSNQPVTTKYIYYARKAGARVLVVNPYREPGLDRYWIPSALESALFGTRLADRFFHVNIGGDAAFFTGVLKALCESGGLDEPFIREHTAGFAEVAATTAALDWVALESQSGSSRAEMTDFARLVGEARNGVFVWSMGVTQHRHGVDNVRAILNLALARGFVGRENCGVMPIRGHSGVQGGAEMGAYSTSFPGGMPITPETASKLETVWGFRPPDKPGLTTSDIIRAAHDGEVDVLYCAGGNFLETMPAPDYTRTALERIRLRVHQDIVVTTQMLADTGDTVILLPACTRYEQTGGGTETSTERRVIFSPEIPGRRIGEARSEWEIFMSVAERARPDRASLIHFEDAQAIRSEIARVVPAYDGIQNLTKAGDSFQWGGARLCRDYVIPTPDAKAHFIPVYLAGVRSAAPPGKFLLSTRRGKQFNSMVQGSVDPLTGAHRDAVFMAPADAAELGLSNGNSVLVRSESGSMRARVTIAAMTPRNVQVYWPEGNALIPRDRDEPESRVPDYNAIVEILPQPDEKTQTPAVPRSRTRSSR